MKSESTEVFEMLGRIKATRETFAKIVRMARQSVAPWIKDGVLAPGGTYLDWIGAYSESLRETAAGRTGGSEVDSELTLEKTRLTKAQADKAELEVGILEGSLVKVKAVEAEFGDLITAARARLLSLPGKAAVLVMAAENLREGEDVIKKLVYEALEELARDPESPAGEAERADPEALEPPARADDQSVGGREPEAKPRRQRRARPVQ